MKVRFSGSLLLTACVCLLATSALATSVTVANYSFETNNGFNNFCGGSCEYSTGIAIPSWNTSGFATGQWIVGGFAGNPPAFDGSVLAYTNGGAIWQDVASAVAGTTYTLQVEVLHRTDELFAAVVQLEVGGSVVTTATGPDAGPGTWNNWTAVYTAAPADAGKTVTILLSAGGAQGDFDFVRLDSSTSVPEPMTMLLLGSGLGLSALQSRFRRG